MIIRTTKRRFDVMVITNEMPLNRIGGVGSVMENLMSGFDQIGVEYLVFLTRHTYTDREIQDLFKAWPTLCVGRFEDLERFSAPVVHIHSYNNDGDLFAFIRNKKSVYTIHSLLICEAHSNDVDLSYSIAQQEALISACDRIVLVSWSEYEAYRVQGYHRLNPSVDVVYNGLKDHGTQRNAARPPSGVIGFCGRLVPRKRPEYVQMILNEKEFEHHRTMIAGRGFSRYAGQLVEDLGLTDRVRYLGWCGGPRLQAFYDTIDTLAIPSAYEPFGMVALEAASRGIPVICNRVGGLHEILGDHAFYFDEDAYPSFRQAARSWLNAENDTLQTKIHGARKRYETYFTDIAMATRYAELYDDVAALDGDERLDLGRDGG